MLIHESRTYCPACFTELMADAAVCPVCGYSDRNPGERFPVALPLGTVLMSKYVIGNVLGKGGFGITYLAYNLRDNKITAIKEYLPDALVHRNTGDTAVSTFKGEKAEDFNLGAEKFYEEAKTVSKFNGHPNVINVYEFFYENNTAYFVMEYVRGIDLKDHVRSHGGRLSEAETIKLILPVLDALIAVHSIGVLHRDISPDNIFICYDGNVKLLDFGSARQVLGQQSHSLSVILKPGFAPVEQYQTKGNQGPWTDIYSLAATMYYCITGSVPEDCMNRVTRDTLVPPSAMGIKLTTLFENILLKALAFQASDRYQSVFQLKEDMKRILIYTVDASNEPEAPIIVNAAYSAGEAPYPAAKRKLRIILGVIAACVVIIGGITTAVLISNNALLPAGRTGGSNTKTTAASGSTASGNRNNIAGASAERPTKALTEEPTTTLALTPTMEPTAAPTPAPSPEPTNAPTPTPIAAPTDAPALSPTGKILF